MFAYKFANRMVYIAKYMQMLLILLSSVMTLQSSWHCIIPHAFLFSTILYKKSVRSLAAVVNLGSILSSDLSILIAPIKIYIYTNSHGSMKPVYKH